MKYQSEIDGLRALAVMMVVLFHAGLPISGGFVGVDVFFVISGYLITGIIFNDIAAGKFSLPRFWERRIRRILPASFFTLIAVLVIGSLFMLPTDFARLAKSAVAQALMAANVFFWRDVDYFTGSAETKPLLHMWSLAVEEQFYLFYPVFLMFVAKLGRQRLSLAFAVLSIGSFVLNVWGVFYRPQAAFYLLPTRAWELLIGGWTSIGTPLVLRFWPRELMSFGGITMVIGSALIYDSNTPFPGFAALIPCLGTAMFILSNSVEKTTLGRFFSFRPIVFVGLISYSLYLWHWPIMAFARYLMFDFTLPVILKNLALSFLAAILSWRFIEQSFRAKKGNALPRYKLVFTSAFITLLSLVVGAGLICKLNGIPSRFAASFANYVDDATWNGDSYKLTNVEVKNNSYKTIGNVDGPISFAVLGDSHALMTAEALDLAAAKIGLRGWFVAERGNPPLPFVWRKNQKSRKLDAERTFLYILNSGIQDVILISRWSLYLEGYSEAELRYEERGRLANDGLIQDAFSKDICTTDAERVLREHLGELVNGFTQKGIRVWIFRQVPEQKGPVGMPHFLSKLIGWDYPDFRTTLALHLQRQKKIEGILKEIQIDQGDKAKILATDESFFDQQLRSVVVLEGRACYRDNDHLSRFGSARLLMPTIENMFQEISENR